MNWTEILGNAGIGEPPGYIETCALMEERKKDLRLVQERETEEKKAEAEAKLAAAAHRATRKGRRR